MNAITFITLLSFFLTMFFIFTRPKGVNEAIPSTIGALVVLIFGNITIANLLDISSKISGAALTIIATLMMALVLESIGFFHWTTAALAKYAKGSGVRLFWLINIMCFLMTIFFNNDGSIIITTPIILLVLEKYRLNIPQKIPYLISGALIATASSAPIGVSNIVNLIALNIIHLSLYSQISMMLVPATIGLLFLAGLLYLFYRKDLPKKLPEITIPFAIQDKPFHPLQNGPSHTEKSKNLKVMKGIVFFVLIVRIGLFIASYFGIPVDIVAMAGSIILLGWRWYYLKISPRDILAKTPWHIFIFAYTMYIIIYGLNNIGLTEMLVKILHPLIMTNLFNATFLMGGLLTILSNLFDNHPALMMGTLTLTKMGLNPITVKTVYLANIVGSDIGSLILPIGTLASLMWIHIVNREKVKIKWATYIRTTIVVIPLTVIFTLYALYIWIELFFNGKPL